MKQTRQARSGRRDHAVLPNNSRNFDERLVGSLVVFTSHCLNTRLWDIISCMPQFYDVCWVSPALFWNFFLKSFLLVSVDLTNYPLTQAHRNVESSSPLWTITDAHGKVWGMMASLLLLISQLSMKWVTRYWSRTESTNSMLPLSLPGRRFHERERFSMQNTSLQIIYDWSSFSLRFSNSFAARRKRLESPSPSPRGCELSASTGFSTSVKNTTDDADPLLRSSRGQCRDESLHSHQVRRGTRGG